MSCQYPPPCLKIWFEAQPSSPLLLQKGGGGGAHYESVSKLKFVGALAFYVEKYHFKDEKIDIISYVHNVVRNAIIKQFLLKVSA